MMKNTFVNSYGEEFSQEEIIQQLMSRVSQLENSLDDVNELVDTLLSRLVYLEGENDKF